MTKADRGGTLVLRNARILTFDPERPRASALAIAGDRILAIGDEAEIAAAAPDSNVIDLDGACVIPGFNDAHAHMEREGLKTLRPSLAHARSIEDVLGVVRDAASRTPPGEWIVTMPFGAPPFYFDGPATLAEGRSPNRHELDRAAPDHPVYIPGVFGNWGKPPGVSALNSRALALNCVDRGSAPKCAGVEILKDAAGEPTGVIVERNNRPTIEFDLLPNVPGFGFEDRLEGVRIAQKLYNATGVTSVYEGHGSAAETISVYRRLWENRELTVRTGLVVSPSWRDLAEAERIMRDWLGVARGAGLGDPWLKVSGVHVAYGGDATLACCARAQLPDTGWTGFHEQATTPSDFREACFLAAEHDLRLHTIVGDRLHEIRPVLEDVDRHHGIRGRRWVIEHVARARRADIEALGRLGVLVTTIPTYHLWKGGDRYLDEPDGGDAVVPHRWLLDAGVPLALGTDNIPYDPLFTLWVACARQERTSSRAIGAGQALDPEAALHALTVAGAELTFDEGWKGPLKPGFAADLAVLSDDPTQAEIACLQHISCLMTLAGGAVVHEAASRPFTRS